MRGFVLASSKNVGVVADAAVTAIAQNKMSKVILPKRLVMLVIGSS
jgi:hypothetical protein